jgi:hypothetical protein
VPKVERHSRYHVEEADTVKHDENCLYVIALNFQGAVAGPRRTSLQVSNAGGPVTVKKLLLQGSLLLAHTPCASQVLK